ncbi:related to protein ste16 [Ceraceosorus bombacis]|uniref:Related to protein ste16 n=1 Tax=Ceraceosorus bombacis TaxID=401625 RepID=A0A0P1BER5_9BASI|nr:related to protein ste16 [Ceraceosorus bombacis]
MADLLEELENRLDIELKIKDGAENLLLVFSSGNHAGIPGPPLGQSANAGPGPSSAASIKGREALRKQVERELEAADRKIEALGRQIAELRVRAVSPAPSTTLSEASYGYTQPGSALGLQSPRGGTLPMTQNQEAVRAPPLFYNGSPRGQYATVASQDRSMYNTAGLDKSPSLAGRELITEASRRSSETQRGVKPIEDAEAARNHVQALMRNLAQLSKLASLTDESGGAAKASNGSESLSSMGPPTTPSMTRSAQRARAAAMAKSEAHQRTPSHAHGLGDLARRRQSVLTQLAGLLRCNARVRYETDPDELLDCVLPCLSDGSGKEVRGAAYRTLRCALIRPPWALIARARSRGLDIFLMQTFIRDNRFEYEREQALKLVRAIIDAAVLDDFSRTPDQDDIMSSAVIRALVAVAEHHNDKLRHLCLETLMELALHDLPLLIRGGGLRSVLNGIANGPPELAPALAQAVLLLVDVPSTRCHFAPGSDVEVGLSGFTDAPAVDGVGQNEMLRITSQVVLVMLRSWTGLLYLCNKKSHALRSLVLALRVSRHSVREAILDMLQQAFAVGLSSKSGQKEHETRRSTNTATAQRYPFTGAQQDLSEEGRRRRLHLVDHYLALLLVVMIDAGLLDAVVHVLETAPELTRSASMLMGQLVQTADRVLPRSYGAAVHAFPHLFTMVSRFGSEQDRQRAIGALSAIESHARSRARTRNSRDSTSAHGVPSSIRPRNRADSVEDARRRGGDNSKPRQIVILDDAEFRNRIVDTQVLNTRDHTRWSFDKLMDLFEGPLMNAKRLEEATRSMKFARRIIAFYQPFSLRFATIPKTTANLRWIRLGCALLTTLSSCPDGLRFLAETRFLREVRECLEQLLPLAPAGQVIGAGEAIFSRIRIVETLTGGYFEMLGVLTKTPEGLRILEQNHLFTALYALSELRSRDDLMRLMLEKFDYSIEGHARILFSKVLTSTYEPMRLFATQHLASLIKKSVLPTHWAIRLLLTQLYDPSLDVREEAALILKDICKSTAMLNIVVSMSPVLEHLGDSSHALLLMFMSTSVGLRYLLQGGYIEREMDDWFHHRNQRYAVQLEVLLARAFSIHQADDDPKLHEEFDGTVPTHFYGELAKTHEGCEVLSRKGHFAEFARFIRLHGSEFEDLEIIAKLKSILWAVGNIGSTACGLPFLENEDIIAVIVDIAETSLVLSVRGTCFFTLGLIASTSPGAELLQDFGWDCAFTTFGTPISLCVPRNLDAFVTIPPWQVKTSADLRYLELKKPDGGIESAIMLCISNLGNSVQANKASRSLAKLRAQHRFMFQDRSLFCRALELLESHHYRQPVRKFIWELFNVRLDEHLALDLRDIRKRLADRSRTASSHPRSMSTLRHLRSSSDGAGTRPGASLHVNGAARTASRQDVLESEEEEVELLSEAPGDRRASILDDEGDMTADEDELNSQASISVMAEGEDVGDDALLDEGILRDLDLGPQAKSRVKSYEPPTQRLLPHHRLVGGFNTADEVADSFQPSGLLGPRVSASRT